MPINDAFVELDKHICRIRRCYDSDSPECYLMGCRYMLSCLPIIESGLAAVELRNAKDEAFHYWHGVGSSTKTLADARDRCWKYINELSVSEEQESHRYLAARTLVCCLYEKPEEGDDIVEVLGVFVGYVIDIVGWDERLKANLFEYFPLLNTHAG